MADNPHILDDYPVEKFHSLLRARTNDWDTPKEIQRKARLIDANNQDLQQFATHFVPQRNAMMNQNQLWRLKVEAAKYLLSVIAEFSENPFAVQEQPRLPRQRKWISRWVLPHLFRETPIKNDFVPLAYQWYGDATIAQRLKKTGRTARYKLDQFNSEPVIAPAA